MTQPNTVRVTPEELTTLANALSGASKAIRQAVYQDPVMLSDAQLYAEYFGPPQEVGQQYATLADNFLTYITGAMTQLTDGAQVISNTAAGFAAVAAQNAQGIKTGAQPR